MSKTDKAGCESPIADRSPLLDTYYMRDVTVTFACGHAHDYAMYERVDWKCPTCGVSMTVGKVVPRGN